MKRRRSAGLHLVLPFAVLLALTVLVPVLYTVYLSLFTDRLSGLGFDGPRQVFTGLGNYLSVVVDRAFGQSVLTVALYALVQVPMMLVLAMVLALLLDSAVVRMRQVWTLALFLPYAVPVVIGGLVWAYLYSPGVGPLASVLHFDPLSGRGILPAVVNIATWQWVGYNVVIFYTALRAVPKEILEAARADGAGPVRTALTIKARWCGRRRSWRWCSPSSARCSCSPSRWCCAVSPGP